MNNDDIDKNEAYNINSINEALDQLGMLSSITHSRKEYINENEKFFCKLQNLNMNGEKAGPSCVNEVDIPFQKNLLIIDKKSNESENYKVGLLDPKEKENKVFEGLHIVTMNSQFITSFNSGYSFPLNEFTDSPSRKVYKYYMKRRKCRSQPYDKKSLVKVVERCSDKNIENLNELEQTACRLRTASLSSGTSSSRRVALEKHRSTVKSICGLQRSKSMENLIGSMENSFVGCDKTKDIETVSKGIQEMQMEDCT